MIRIILLACAICGKARDMLLVSVGLLAMALGLALLSTVEDTRAQGDPARPFLEAR